MEHTAQAAAGNIVVGGNLAEVALHSPAEAEADHTGHKLDNSPAVAEDGLGVGTECPVVLEWGIGGRGQVAHRAVVVGAVKPLEGVGAA